MRLNLLLFFVLASTAFSIDPFISMLWDENLDRYGMLGLPGGNSSSSASLSRDVKINEEWMDQKLDHFDPTNTMRWKQPPEFGFRKRADLSASQWRIGNFRGVALFRPDSPELLPEIQCCSTDQVRASLYGHSRPTADMSVDNLRYLSSEQALQDAAEFIKYFSEKHGYTNNKWIVFGGSYAGNLAAWMRLKYPDLVAGAVASSAPVKAVLDFEGYFRTVTTVLGNKCTENIREAIVQVEGMLKNPQDWQRLKSIFKLCGDLDGNNSMDVSMFFQSLAAKFERMVQYCFPGSNSIYLTCEEMADETQSPINRLAYVTKGLTCMPFKYEHYISVLKEISWMSVYPWLRPWHYQTCTEFGYNRIVDDHQHPFGSHMNADAFVKACMDAFGPKFNRAFIENGIAKTNSLYGSTDIQVTNVVFVNGLIDPWHSLSVLKDINPSAISIVIPETSHGADLLSSMPYDPPSLQKARETIAEYIQKFLQ